MNVKGIVGLIAFVIILNVLSEKFGWGWTFF